MTITQTLVKKGRDLLLVIGSLALAACGDASTAPQQSIDRVAAARVMPTVADARVRVSLGIENTALRQRLVHDLIELENALTNGDGQKARFHVRLTGTLLTDYRAQQGSSAKDGAEVSAIVLALYTVSQAIDAGFILE